VGLWADRTQGPGSPEGKMWRGLAAWNNPFRNQIVDRRPSSEAPTDMVPTESMIGEFGRAKDNARMLYFGFGDCMTWNPGHCNSDPVNLSIAQAVLGLGRAATTVMMMRGLNYDGAEGASPGSRDSPLFDLWTALSSQIHTRKEVFGNYPGREDGPIPLAVFAPPSITNVWWGANQCKAKRVSHTWQNFRKQVRALHGRPQRRAVDGGRAHARPSKCAAEQMCHLAGRRGGEGARAAEHMCGRVYVAGRRGGSGGLPPTTPERRSPLPPEPASAAEGHSSELLQASSCKSSQ
jgi:hypothetical protein